LESAKATQYTLQSEMFSDWEDFKNLAESDQYENSDGTPKYDQRALPEFHVANNNWLASEIKYKTQAQVISQAQAALNSAWLSYIQSSPIITSPTDGMVTSLMYASGMSIGSLDTGDSTSNQKIATIKTEGTPIVSVNLSEIDVSKVKIGQQVTVKLDSIADKTFTGKVVGVDSIGQTTSGVTQYPSIIQLDTAAPEILPNMTVTATIIIDSKDNVLLVPNGSVQTTDGQSFVTTLANGNTQSVLVETGLSSDSMTEIVSGLNEGDEVVVTSLASQVSSQQGEASPFGGAGMGGMFRMAR
jgi:multidrug efflux pump subunit AcrA (membrane-fusion protein)